MYRVLVVDDEEPVLDSYEFMLKGGKEFSLAGKARTGFEALKLIHELEPDLVFMDINIPGINGLEVIADVHKKFPAMVFVLSTAYERFDLAQRAIPLGVFAYLVKPVSKKTFLSTLDTARESLQSRSTLSPEAGSLEAVSPWQRFLRKTIWKPVSAAEWEHYREELDLPSDKGIVFILETGDMEKYCTALAEHISYKRHCIHDAMLNRCLFLVSGETNRETLAEELDRAIAGVLPPQNEYFLGLGDLYPGPELYLSCTGALRDLENRRKQGGGKAQSLERQLLIQLRRKTGVADLDETRKLFALLRDSIFATGDFTAARAKMIPVFMFLLDDIFHCYSGSDGEAPPFDAAEEIMALKDPAAWETWSNSAFEKLLAEAARRRSGDFPLPLVKAIAHIQEHYADPLLQLSAVAEIAQVSPAYLSRLFPEHLAASFVDYLTSFRIEKSEKLIRESSLSIKEIAFAVGYQDPNYFSKIFRKLRGWSPSEYADKNLQKGRREG